MEAGRPEPAMARATSSSALDSDCQAAAGPSWERRRATFAEPPLPRSMPSWILHQTPDVHTHDGDGDDEDGEEDTRQKAKEEEEEERKRRAKESEKKRLEGINDRY